ncbi:MAG: cytochrome c3 family protein [Deltaproteobacteria bacterium]|nr:cytochrome c3 family protein [Deltaproteobacteria bacterium]
MGGLPRLVAALVFGGACASACARETAPPPRNVAGGASRAEGDCASCHPAIVEEWRSSFHRTAFSDASFQRSLSLEEPKEHAFCLRCHAPAERTAGREAGVTCDSCHGTPHEPARASRASGAGESCASCHEFSFDDGRADLVQKTVSEHAASAFAGVACSDCHMPRVDGHKDHRFLAGHDPKGRIASAVHVDLRRVAGEKVAAVRVTVRVDAGHAFPTGDMFRRARLQIFAEDATGAIVADAERVFGRTWGSEGPGPHAGRRKETSDTRIRGTYDERIVLESGASARIIVRVRWSLLYERVLAMRGPHVELASSDVVASGDMMW